MDDQSKRFTPIDTEKLGDEIVDVIHKHIKNLDGEKYNGGDVLGAISYATGLMILRMSQGDPEVAGRLVLGFAGMFKNNMVPSLVMAIAEGMAEND